MWWVFAPVALINKGYLLFYTNKKRANYQGFTTMFLLHFV